MGVCAYLGIGVHTKSSVSVVAHSFLSGKKIDLRGAQEANYGTLQSTRSKQAISKDLHANLHCKCVSASCVNWA